MTNPLHSSNHEDTLAADLLSREYSKSLSYLQQDNVEQDQINSNKFFSYITCQYLELSHFRLIFFVTFFFNIFYFFLEFVHFLDLILNYKVKHSNDDTTDDINNINDDTILNSSNDDDSKEFTLSYYSIGLTFAIISTFGLLINCFLLTTFIFSHLPRKITPLISMTICFVLILLQIIEVSVFNSLFSLSKSFLMCILTLFLIIQIITILLLFRYWEYARYQSGADLISILSLDSSFKSINTKSSYNSNASKNSYNLENSNSVDTLNRALSQV